MQGKAMVGALLIVGAMILIGSSLMAPWYRIDAKSEYGSVTSSGYIEFYFDSIKANYFGMTSETKYDDATEDASYIETFRTTRILVFVGIIGCFLGLMGAIMVTYETVNYKIGALLVLLAVVLSLFAPMYLMFALPGSFKEDMSDDGEGQVVIFINEKLSKEFFGSEKLENGITEEVTWGGSLGWFMNFFAIIMCAVALFFVATSKVESEKIQRYPSISSTTLGRPSFPTAHKEEGWSDYGTYETSESIETEAPLVFPPFGPKPAGSTLTRRFQCPECEGIVVISVPKRPLDVKCSKCGASGIVE